MKIDDALKEWGDYQGAEAEPADFDAFWDKAKAELNLLQQLQNAMIFLLQVFIIQKFMRNCYCLKNQIQNIQCFYNFMDTTAMLAIGLINYL